MKIGISCNALKHSGGLERYAMDLVRGLAARGQRPAFFARKFDLAVPESQLVERYRINVSFLPGKWRDAWFSTQLAALRRLLKVPPANTVVLRRRLADAAVAKGGYLFY